MAFAKVALCDGVTAVALPLAQDHKRIGEGDTGPNTGGMGAYAPAPVPYAVEELTATFKVRRRHILAKYAGQIDGLYRGDAGGGVEGP